MAFKTCSDVPRKMRWNILLCFIFAKLIKSENIFMGGSPGLVVPKVLGSNPGDINLMDIWTFFRIDLL